MKTSTITAAARRPTWARILLAALLALSVSGCNHMSAGGAPPEVEQDGGDSGGY